MCTADHATQPAPWTLDSPDRPAADAPVTGVAASSETSILVSLTPEKYQSANDYLRTRVIVEDWYMSGESTSSDLYHYISDNVRKGDA
jgi:hypothetical protein